MGHPFSSSVDPSGRAVDVRTGMAATLDIKAIDFKQLVIDGS
jgi:hypothetical protein